MSIWSASSTLGESWNRQPLPFSFPQRRPLERRLSLPPVPTGAHFPPRGPLAGTANDEPPKARILVIEDQAVVALDLQRTLCEAGYRIVGPAATLTDIQRLVARGSIDGAILDIDVNRRTPLPVADVLAFAEIPFVFLTGGGPVDLPQRHAHRPLVEKPYVGDALVAGLAKAMAREAPQTVESVQGAASGWPRVFPQL
jgi:CheY-like chemotaxis protein